MKLVPPVSLEDKAAIRRYLQKLASRLGPEAVPVHAGLILTGLTASALIGTNASKLLESVTVGTGLDYTRPNLTLSHLGIEALTDPGADRIFFWDNSASASKWLTVGNSVAITTTTIDTIQDIRTSASPQFTNLTLTGTQAIGTSLDANIDLKIANTHSAADADQYAADFIVTQDTAAAFSILGLRSGAISTHTSGTIAALYGYQSLAQAQSDSNVTSIYGVYGQADILATKTPSVTVLAGITGLAAANDAAVTYGISIWGAAPTKTGGSIGNALSCYLENPTSGTTQNLSLLALGDILVVSDKKIILEGALGGTGDTYFTYDSSDVTLDCFVNGTEIWSASTTIFTVSVDIATDRWLNQISNTFLGMGVAGTGDLNHGSGAEGYYNTFIGAGAGRDIYTGYANVVIGSDGCKEITTGYKNVSVGDNTLISLIGGYENTVLGQGAGYSLVSGNGDVFLGKDAGYYETGSSKLFIDNALRANEADGRIKALIYGVFAAAVADQDLVFNADVGINTIPTLPLDVKAKAGITAIGGYAIKLTNKTGGNTVAGQLVVTSIPLGADTDDAFETAAASADNVIGVVLDVGVADGSEAWIVISGIADVLMNGGGSVRGDRIISSSTAGSADVWNTGGAVATHFLEIGHCIETRIGAGLARCVLHFN